MAYEIWILTYMITIPVDLKINKKIKTYTEIIFMHIKREISGKTLLQMFNYIRNKYNEFH